MFRLCYTPNASHRAPRSHAPNAASFNGEKQKSIQLKGAGLEFFKMISMGQRVAAGRLLRLLLMLAVVWLWPLWKVFWGRPLPSRA